MSLFAGRPGVTRRRISRPHKVHATQVAAIATGTVVLAAIVTGLLVNLFVSHRLVAQVSDQVRASLAAAVRDPSAALRAPRGDLRFQDPGGRYGLGIYGSPIFFWQVVGDRIVRASSGAPAVAMADVDPGSTSVVELGSGRFVVAAARSGSTLLVAGESLAELDHVRSVLETSELVALPLLALVAFLGSFAIGIRSVVPVEEARRRQLDFTADASHELRTPLSVIEAELALARRAGIAPAAGAAADTAAADTAAADGVATDGTAQLLERIGAETGRLTRIVEDLLWLARFDAEPRPPSAEPVELGAVVSACAERFRPVALGRGVRLTVVPPGRLAPVAPPAPPPLEAPVILVAAPAEWVDRLTGVLVDNACKFAGSGGSVYVSVHVAGSRAVLTVEDSGPGIADGQRDQLFERFGSSAGRNAGHGLGLAIADSVVRSTRGHWHIDLSPVLGGARFEVFWPLAGSRGRRSSAALA